MTNDTRFLSCDEQFIYATHNNLQTQLTYQSTAVDNSKQIFKQQNFKTQLGKCLQLLFAICILYLCTLVDFFHFKKKIALLSTSHNRENFSCVLLMLIQLFSSISVNRYKNIQTGFALILFVLYCCFKSIFRVCPFHAPILYSFYQNNL